MRSSESRQSSRRASKGRKQGDSPFQIAVHDGEEHLEEEVDGVDQHRQQVEPGLAGHDGHEIDSSRGLGELYSNGEQGRKQEGVLAMSGSADRRVRNWRWVFVGVRAQGRRRNHRERGR